MRSDSRKNPRPSYEWTRRRDGAHVLTITVKRRRLAQQRARNARRDRDRKAGR